MTFVRRSATAALTLLILFILSAFGLLAFKGGTFDPYALVMGGVVTIIMLLLYNVTNRVFGQIDRIVLICCMILASIGLVFLYRINPEYGWKQLAWLLTGIIALYIAIAIFKSDWDFGRISWLFLAATAALLLLAFIFARFIGGAKDVYKRQHYIYLTYLCLNKK